MFRLGLIGYPIKHSLSPWIHKQFLANAQLSGSYLLHEINPEATLLDQEITKLKSEFHGFNVTLPFKQTIVPFVDELDPSAETIGAINTVVNKGGKWIGYNTDGIGYVRSLENEFPHIFGHSCTKILIIGAGGAARGIYHALINRGFVNIDLTNRTKSTAEEIARLGVGKAKTNVFSLRHVHEVIKTFDVIIQTTSVGMKPKANKSILQLDQLKEGAIVSDIVYQPIQTHFLQQAKAKGARIHYGHAMLLYQAQYAFEIWTNKKVALDDLTDKLKEKLEGGSHVNR